MSEVKKGNGLVYKNHPLRRVDNLIYYGSMADKYIVLLQILDTKKEQDMDVATRVSVQLQMTDPDLKSRDRGLHLAGARPGRQVSRFIHTR